MTVPTRETTTTPAGFEYHPFNFFTHPQQNQGVRVTPTEPKVADGESKDLIVTIVILNGALVFVILTVCACLALRWKMNKRSTRPYMGSIKSRNYSQGPDAVFGRRISGENPVDYKSFINNHTNLGRQARIFK